MITPSEIQDRQFKSGLGYDKKEVEQFLQDIASDLATLQAENAEQKQKLKDANEALAYYKSIEKTLQRALVLAEKTAQDTRATALREAEAIEKEAKAKALQILNDARKQIELHEHRILNLVQQYDVFKINFLNLIKAQQDLLNSKSFSTDTLAFTYQKDNNAFDGGKSQENSRELHAELPEASQQVQEDRNQLKFDFPSEESVPVSYKTEDGFEFFTMKD